MATTGRRVLRAALCAIWSTILVGCSGAANDPSQHLSSSTAGGARRAPTVILISFDGFRRDYPELHGAPTLLRLAENGVRAEGLVPVFPSKTFPNHYSVVTGLYAEHHGIVGNNMWDPEWNARFSLGARSEVENGRWWEGEPIWVTAENQGQVAATYFWPGSEAAISSVRPTLWKRFDDLVPGLDRVDEVLAWLDLPAGERPTIVTLYFSDVDTAGHRYGPTAPETKEAVRRVDGYLERLVEGLKSRGTFDQTNIIVTSDHGMAQMDPEQVIVLEDYIDLEKVRIVDLSCIAMMRPVPGYEEEILHALEGAHANLHVSKRQDVPERFHYRDHRRITPIVAWVDTGWYIYATHKERERTRPIFSLGTHGFDNQEVDMQGIFIAHGPALKRGLKVPAIENVHIYELMTTILGLEPASNDGDRSKIEPLLSLPSQLVN